MGTVYFLYVKIKTAKAECRSDYVYVKLVCANAVAFDTVVKMKHEKSENSPFW